MKQRDAFLGGEGDAWFRRNHAGLESREFGLSDTISAALARLVSSSVPGPPVRRILEIGCGEARRFEWLTSDLGLLPTGIDPSAMAVQAARARGLDVVQGTAEQLPFPDASFDVVVFGFCLYLCDPQDLFKIAAEADRVLEREGWIVIYDFYSRSFTAREYHHNPAILSRKMDLRQLFDWHPSYTCVSHEVRHHVSGEYTDAAAEWVALSVLRKANGVEG